MRWRPHGRTRARRDGLGMTHHAIPSQEFRSTIAGPPGDVLLSQTDYEQVTQELESLRSVQRADLEARLRDARDFESVGDGDDRMSVLEDKRPDEARSTRAIRRVRHGRRRRGRRPGAAGWARGFASRMTRAETPSTQLVGRRTAGDPTQITPASPVGEALLGAQTGDTVASPSPTGDSAPSPVLGVSAT